MHHTVQEGHIRAQVVLNGQIGKFCQLNLPGVGHNELGPLFLGPDDPVGDQGVTGRCIGTDYKNEF